MNFQSFKASTNSDYPPKGMSPALEAMWNQAKGDWDEAHRLAQSDKSPNGCLVHAYLHRVEGDNGNAAYWYRMAGKDVCTSRLVEEWEEIVVSLI